MHNIWQALSGEFKREVDIHHYMLLYISLYVPAFGQSQCLLFSGLPGQQFERTRGSQLYTMDYLPGDDSPFGLRCENILCLRTFWMFLSVSFNPWSPPLLTMVST